MPFAENTNAILQDLGWLRTQVQVFMKGGTESLSEDVETECVWRTLHNQLNRKIRLPKNDKVDEKFVAGVLFEGTCWEG